MADGPYSLYPMWDGQMQVIFNNQRDGYIVTPAKSLLIQKVSLKIYYAVCLPKISYESLVTVEHRLYDAEETTEKRHINDNVV